MKNKFLPFLLCYLLSVAFFTNKVSAQSLSLSISPPLLEVMIKPGKSITQVYKLFNDGEPVVITPRLLELGQNGIIDDPNFVPDKWISIVSDEITLDNPFLLQSQKEADFLLKVNPDAGTAEKDYYRVLVFTTTPNPPGDTTMSSFSQNLASPILVTVTATGILTKAAQITKFDLPKIVDSFDPLVTDIEVKNTGKTYFRPVGKITLTGIIGRGSYDIVPSAILTGENKQLVTDFLPPVSQELKTLYLPGFYLGKYKLDVNFNFDEGNSGLSQTKTFYAIPWKIGSAFFIFLIFIVMMNRRKRKSQKHKESV